MRFKQPSSSSTFLGSPWRAAKESGHVITSDVMNKFAAEGFMYRGKVDMALLNQRTGYKAAPAHRWGHVVGRVLSIFVGQTVCMLFIERNAFEVCACSQALQ